MAQEMIERKDVWRTLKTNFTEKEKLTMADQISSCIRERNRLEEEFASVKKQYASDIGKQEAEISSLAERFNTGWEMRRVECVEVKDFNNGSVMVFRKGPDPSGAIEERPMTNEERQMGLFENKPVPTELAKTEEVPGTLHPPVGTLNLSLDESQDEPEQEKTLQKGVGTGDGDVVDVEFQPEEPEKKEESELPEDTNKFYTQEKEVPQNAKKQGKRGK